MNVLYLSSFPPRECGIANFTKNSIEAVHSVDPDISQKVIAVNEVAASKRDYLDLVVSQLNQEELDSYKKTALYINESGADVLFLQHEYGLFGGSDGVFILRLLEKIKIPIVSFLHSIPVLKRAKRRDFRLWILENIGKISKYVITTAEIGKEVLTKECSIRQEKIALVRHGGYDIAYPTKKEKEKIKKEHNLKGKFVILSYGLITKSKGFDYGLEAVAKLRDKYPEIFYLILGVPHPIHASLMEKGDCSTLQRKIKELKIENNVKLVGRFLERNELIENLKMADVFLLPYLSKTQISSGVLANAVTCGNCVVSTPFSYAKEIIQKNRGYLVDFASSDSIVEVLTNLIENPQKIEETRLAAYGLGRSFTWQRMAENFVRIFGRVVFAEKS